MTTSLPTLDSLDAGFMNLLALPQTVVPAAAPGGTVEAGEGRGLGSEAAAAVAAAAVVGPGPIPRMPVATLGSCCRVDPRAKGWHLDARVAPEQVVEAARLVDRQGFAIDAVTGVDWIGAGEMEVVYDFYHPLSPLRVVVRTRVPRARPEVPTISEVFPGANWHERETHEFFGIRFLGHPNLTPLLLPEDAEYHPLRKDFAGAP